MAQWLRIHPVFTEDLNSVPSTETGQIMTTYNSITRRSSAHFIGRKYLSPCRYSILIQFYSIQFYLLLESQNLLFLGLIREHGQSFFVLEIKYTYSNLHFTNNSHVCEPISMKELEGMEAFLARQWILGNPYNCQGSMNVNT